MRLHGGCVKLTSELGRGTVATVVIPRERAVAMDGSGDERRQADQKDHDQRQRPAHQPGEAQPCPAVTIEFQIDGHNQVSPEAIFSPLI